ncbi:7-cyano-7-deazaguanine synthase [Shimia sp. SDUM112013]|uniref:7-cyano-7-deazaguanine synthase n=1 Tax=Shimia sp. SDUM112013 TaxID=3136160 RepID=UPI0032EC3AC3
MVGGAMPFEHRVRCLPPLTKSGGDAQLRLTIDGKPVGVKVCISHLSAQLVADLSDRTMDLLEVAAVVYGADAAVSRGGTADRQMGAQWHRHFEVEMPVRDLAFWDCTEVVSALEEMLMFLSGDRFVFRFLAKEGGEAERSLFFKFDEASAWQPTRVLMFSGGLDSFAGALEEIAEQNQRVALVSHFSASKIAPVQRNLHKALALKFGEGCCRHISVQVQMVGKGLKDGTHRARSFLFAALGAVTAQAYNLNRVSFYENGIVSLNLSPVGNVLGTRATRTTHPQTLTRFSDFLSLVFKSETRIDNPFFWRTKREVVETVARLGMTDQIAQTRSCADVHNQTKQHIHCGRCSQCIDRRFAVLAAGLDRFDPEEAYRVSLMDDARTDVRDREIALSYLQSACAYEHVTAQELERALPAVISAAGHLAQPTETALHMIAMLLKRHGVGVSEVMRTTLKARGAEDFAEGSLPRLYGEAQRSAFLPKIDSPPIADYEPSKSAIVEVDEGRRRVVIDGEIIIERNATADLVIALAEKWLEGAGQGKALLDYPFESAAKLAQILGLDSDEALRRRVNRARQLLRQKMVSAGREPKEADAVIENQPWHGYRLYPDRITVRKVCDD